MAGKPDKKVKANNDRDIPSSNFSSQKPQQTSCYTHLKPNMITSIPTTKPNLLNPNAVFKGIELSSAQKDALGFDKDELMKFQIKKAQ